MSSTGYCRDPNGRIVIPHEQRIAFVQTDRERPIVLTSHQIDLLSTKAGRCVYIELLGLQWKRFKVKSLGGLMRELENLLISPADWLLALTDELIRFSPEPADAAAIIDTALEEATRAIVKDAQRYRIGAHGSITGPKGELGMAWLTFGDKPSALWATHDEIDAALAENNQHPGGVK